MKMLLSMKLRRIVTMILVISVSAVILGCAFLNGLTSTSTETSTGSTTSTEFPVTQPVSPTEESIPTEMTSTQGPGPTAVPPTNEVPSIPDRPLASGPWLLIEAEDGMWAVNPDGSGLTYLTHEVPIDTQDLGRSASSQGGVVALITTTDALKMTNLTLMLLSLPSGTLEIVTPLTSDDTEPRPDALPGSEDFDIAFTLSGLHNLEWSPNGRQLAFMGAMDGPSSDLYVYSLVSGEIVQLTDGPSQGIRPTWSPDGAYILHAGVGSLGTGAGYDVQGIWAARSDDSSVISLYPIPNESGDEAFLGWVSPSEFLVYTWNVMCGTKNLRIYDITSGETEVLWEDFFSNVIFSPETGTALLSVDEWTADCNPGGSEGMFLLYPGQAMPLKVLDFGTLKSGWYPSVNVFLVNEESKMFAVWPEGEVRRLVDAPGAELPSVSPDGRMWTFGELSQNSGAGLWLGKYGSEVERVLSESVRHVTWSPGGEGLFFFGDAGLYFTPAPNFEPILIAPGLQGIYGDPVVWVWP